MAIPLLPLWHVLHCRHQQASHATILKAVKLRGCLKPLLILVHEQSWVHMCLCCQPCCLANAMTFSFQTFSP